MAGAEGEACTQAPGGQGAGMSCCCFRVQVGAWGEIIWLVDGKQERNQGCTVRCQV